MPEYDILEDTLCIYCQKDFETPRKLQFHVTKEHPGTYASLAIADAKELRRRSNYHHPPDEIDLSG